MQTSKITTVGYVKPETENYIGSDNHKSLDANPLSFNKKDKKGKKKKKESNDHYLEPKDIVKSQKEAQLKADPADQEQTPEEYLERARGEEAEGTIEKGLSKKQEKRDTPYQNLEGQLRLTSNALMLDGFFDNYWSK